jgi:ATPase subunit of ABC transporter with duplicated ATPase domains
MVARAEKMLAGLDDVRVQDRVAKLRFPDPAPCGRTPIMAHNLSKSYGSLEIFTAVDLAIDKGSKVVVIGLNGAGKTTLLRILAGVDEPDTGAIDAGHGLRVGYFAQEHETLDVTQTVLANMMSASPSLG